MYAPTATNGHDPWTSETSSGGQLTANFHIREFASRGTPVPARYHANVRRLAQNLQVLRDTVGRSIRINSGYRTPSHNASVGGAAKSQHLVAKAGDMRIGGMSPAEVYCTIERLIGEGKMEQGGLGVYKTFVHYDVRGRRARWEGRGVKRPSCGGGTSPASGGGSAPAGTSRAVALNRRWMRELGWQDHTDAIVRLLGFRDRTPGEQAFADAVARWQRSRGLTDDGILGPTSWRAMHPLLGSGGSPGSAAPTGGAIAYPVVTGREYGPRWKGRRPPGLPASARKTSAPGAADAHIARIARGVLSDATFVATVRHLAKTESGAAFGRPANIFDVRPKAARPAGKPYISAWGVFQFNRGAWRGLSGVPRGAFPWQATALEELSRPIHKYASVYREVRRAGGSARDGARGIRIWHNGPGYHRRWLGDAKRHGFTAAWRRVDATRRSRIDAHLRRSGI